MLTLAEKTALIEWVRDCSFDRICHDLSDGANGRCLIGVLDEYYGVGLDSDASYSTIGKILGVNHHDLWKLNDDDYDIKWLDDGMIKLVAASTFREFADKLWDIIPVCDEIEIPEQIPVLVD